MILVVRRALSVDISETCRSYYCKYLFVPCGNRTRGTQRSSQSISFCANSGRLKLWVLPVNSIHNAHCSKNTIFILEIRIIFNLFKRFFRRKIGIKNNILYCVIQSYYLSLYRISSRSVQPFGRRYVINPSIHRNCRIYNISQDQLAHCQHINMYIMWTYEYHYCHSYRL